MAAFEALATRLTGSIVLHAPLDTVFPLFSPHGEEEWVEGWRPEILFPRDRDWAEGMVFRTRMGERDEIWVVAELDPGAHRVTYYRVEPDHLVARVEVRCRALDAARTEATVIYSYVGLSSGGNEEIATWTERTYGEKMARWQTTLNEYVRR